MSNHNTQPVMIAGTLPEDATAAVILLHGRGATAESILQLSTELPDGTPSGAITYVAPQASNNVWWSNSGFAPLEDNEPFVSSALQTVAALVEHLVANDIPREKIVIGGFSQGACLAAEFVAQNPARYGGVLVFSGALLGPLDREHNYRGSLEGTPVFIGGVDQDVWVKPPQFALTARLLGDMGANVTTDVQPGNVHAIRPEEITQANAMIQRLLD